MAQAAREDAGLSRDELAERVGLSSEWVQGIETGEIQTPRQRNLQALALALPALDLAKLMVAANLAKIEAEARRLNAASPPFPMPSDRDFEKIKEAWPRLSAKDRALVLGIVRRLAGDPPPAPAADPESTPIPARRSGRRGRPAE